jgi:imidazolonepropionase
MPPAALRPLSLFFHSSEQLLTLAGPPVPRRGRDLDHLGILRGGAVLTRRGRILRVGRTRELKAEARGLKAQWIDCRGCVLMPGFVDSHTHAVFAGSRVEDFEQRLQGRSYEQIAAAGGGIRHSARLLRQATREELTERASRFLRQFAEHGTTTIEVKTGYGLDIANELKTLEVIQKVSRRSPLELVPTLLAAHALPPDYEDRRGEYVQLMIRRLIPAVARRKLAEFVDCFCERVAFGVKDCRQVLNAGRRCGLLPRLHAEQLSRTGGSRLAIEVGAASADHLDALSDSDIRALARSDVVATLLPGTNFHLGLKRYAPARRLIEAGAAVALATDFNPGTSPTLNMQFILALACSAMSMTPAQAIAAATINGAYALRRAHRMGSLEAGKQADLIVMNLDDYRKIPYYFGWNHCLTTVKQGRIIYSAEARR